MPSSEALWYVGDGRAEVRPADVQACVPGYVRVAARFSGISRGTERLVFRGRVPASEHQRMRCPHQAGDFPFPVKYGYALVGCVSEGPADLVGQHVFLLHPHQREACVPTSDVHLVPADVPPRRAALAANMETALNVVWDSGAGPADRVLIVGGGVLGLLIAGILAQMPGADVTVADPDAARAAVAKELGARFAAPKSAPGERDVVIHTSGTADGLATALAAAGTEATVVEASWYGDAKIAAPLGEAFHSRRLKLVSSQVGAVAASRRVRWSHARRMAAALGLLHDARFDALITGDVAFGDAPRALTKIFADNAPGLMTVLRYT